MITTRDHEYPTGGRRFFTLQGLSYGTLFLACLWISQGCSHEEEAAVQPSDEAPAVADGTGQATVYPVFIKRPDGPPRVIVGKKDDGSPLTASCTTCHNSREPNPANNSANDLELFHQGLIYSHGDLGCLACHNDQNYDTLRLADGREVPFVDVMTLCAQCHGAKARAYENGAHGGMNGHWDLTRGPRVRNNCVHCHDPHSPSFPHMTPTFKARDRFLNPSPGEEGSSHE
ncbi:MAG: hypothetical protein RLN60_03590 [Phycisphaerales bacterium]